MVKSMLSLAKKAGRAAEDTQVVDSVVQSDQMPNADVEGLFEDLCRKVVQYSTQIDETEWRTVPQMEDAEKLLKRLCIRVLRALPLDRRQRDMLLFGRLLNVLQIQQQMPQSQVNQSVPLRLDDLPDWLCNACRWRECMRGLLSLHMLLPLRIQPTQVQDDAENDANTEYDTEDLTQVDLSSVDRSAALPSFNTFHSQMTPGPFGCAADVLAWAHTNTTNQAGLHVDLRHAFVQLQLQDFQAINDFLNRAALADCPYRQQSLIPLVNGCTDRFNQYEFRRFATGVREMMAYAFLFHPRGGCLNLRQMGITTRMVRKAISDYYSDVDAIMEELALHIGDIDSSGKHDN